LQHLGLWPISARLGQFVGGVVVAGHQHGRFINGTQDLNADLDLTADVAEIAGTDEDIRCASTLDQPMGGLDIGMQITVQQQLHGQHLRHETSTRLPRWSQR
jgi:hypothetical protein